MCIEGELQMTCPAGRFSQWTGRSSSVMSQLRVTEYWCLDAPGARAGAHRIRKPLRPGRHQPARAGRKPVSYFDRTSPRSAFPRTPPASHAFPGHDDHE